MSLLVARRGSINPRRATGGGGGGTPDTITGLHTWHKADAITGKSDGDPVAQWDDESGNGWHLTQPTSGLEPIYKTGIINGLPVLRFDGAGARYAYADSVFGGLSEGEMFVVIKLVNDPPNVSSKAGAWNFGSSSNRSHYPFTDGVVYESFGSTARKNTGDPTPSLASWRLYNPASSSTEWTSRIDGSVHFTTATNTVGFPSSAIEFGSNYVGGTREFVDGDIAELIIYDNVLSSAYRTTVEDYIADKYGLTIA